MIMRMCDLPHDLVSEEILAKVPITSLRAVRSTCKLWNSLSKDFIVGKATTRQHEFLGFMTMGDKVCSLRFDLQEIGNGDLFNPSTKLLALLDQVEIYKVFHCDGLMLGVKKDSSKLVVWNPYLRQTRWVGPRKRFYRLDRYALGYDNNRNLKILRLDGAIFGQIIDFEIYDFSSSSWRVLDLKPDCEIDYYQRGMTLKGNAYFFAKVTTVAGPEENLEYSYSCFLLCFDFTRERFGLRLPLPFNSDDGEAVTLSCVGEEKLAMLYERCDWDHRSHMLEIWVTNKIEPNAVSWSKFLKVDMWHTYMRFDYYARSFFINEEKKVAVVFDEGKNDENKTDDMQLTAYIIGEDGYLKSVSLEETPNVRMPRIGDFTFSPALVSSSYLPSLVQIKKPKRKSKKRDA